jgi:hypothetical protein
LIDMEECFLQMKWESEKLFKPYLLHIYTEKIGPY